MKSPRRSDFSFALCSAVPSLSIIVVITEIGLRTKTMNPDIAAALVAAGLLSIIAVSDHRRGAVGPGDRAGASPGIRDDGSNIGSPCPRDGA